MLVEWIKIVRYQLNQQYGEIFFSTRASKNCLSSLLPHSLHYLLQFVGSERVRHDLVAEQQQVFTVQVSLPYLPFSLREFWFPSRKYFLLQIVHKGNLISFPGSQCSKGNLISILFRWLVPQEHITKFRPRKHKKRLAGAGCSFSSFQKQLLLSFSRHRWVLHAQEEDYPQRPAKPRVSQEMGQEPLD